MTRKRRGLSMTSILVLALVGTITAIVLGAMAVFLQTYQRSLIRSVQTSARQSVAQVGKTVEDYLDDVNSLMELLERKLEDPRQDRDDFFAAFLQIRPDVVAVTTYDAAGGLVDCRSRGAKRTEIYQNLSFDPNKMDDYADGYVSTPHVASIFQGYYPWVVTLVAPLDAPGREEWIALDISFSSISAYLNDVGIGQHGYCFLMDQSGNIIYHPQQQLIYSDLKRENTSLIAGLPDGSNESGSMIYTLTSLENSHWRVVGVSFVEELITESVQEVSRILAASGIGILLAAVIISFVLFRTLSRPMHGLTAAMRQFEQAADNFTYVPVGGARGARPVGFVRADGRADPAPHGAGACRGGQPAQRRSCAPCRRRSTRTHGIRSCVKPRRDRRKMLRGAAIWDEVKDRLKRAPSVCPAASSSACASREPLPLSRRSC